MNETMHEKQKRLNITEETTFKGKALQLYFPPSLENHFLPSPDLRDTLLHAEKRT